MDLKETNTAVVYHHPWEDVRFSIVQKMIKKQFKKQQHVLVDIGCGDLFFLKKLAQNFPQNTYWGVDTNFTSAFIANEEKQNTPILLTDSIDAVTNVKADVVLLLDVLEHIEHDITFLQKLLTKPFFDDNTVLIITVPAFQGLFISRDVFLEHHRRYNYKSLKRTVNEAGLQIIQQGYFFFSLLLIRCCETIAEKWFNYGVNKPKGIGQWNKGFLITNALKLMLLIDYTCTSFMETFNIKIPGLSNYIVCQKRV